MSKLWYLIQAYWIIPVLILVAVATFLLFRKWRPDDGKDPFRRIKEELGIIQAGSEARNAALELGTEQAIVQIKAKYQAKIETLEATQQAQMAELEDDPVELARYLEGLSR